MENNIILVSYFNSVKSEKSKDISIVDFLENIKQEKHKTDCDIIRNINDKKSRDAEKLKRLSCITTSGVFAKGHTKSEIINHSGLIQIDIDNLSETIIVELKQQLKKDEYVFAYFLSPSGNGLKIIFKIPNQIETHLHSFLAIEKYFSDVYNQQIDKSCKDLSRVMFISSDSNIYTNFNSLVFTELIKNVKETIQNNHLTNDMYTDIEHCLLQIEQNCIDITNDYENWLKIGFALADAIGENGRDFYHRISKQSNKYNYSECDKQYTKCLNGKNNGISIGTFFKICKDYNIEIKSSEIKNNKMDKNDKTTNTKVKPNSRFVQVKNFLHNNFDFRYNIISNEIDCKSKNETNYNSCNENNIYSFLEHNNCAISISKLTILLRSDFVPEYNPFDEYFTNLKPYDSVTEIDYISKLSSYVHAIDKERFGTQLKKMLVRSVACALNDKVFNKQAFILVHSKQNSGKSTFCRWLCPPSLNNYITENLNADKDGLIALSENLFINLDELATLSKTELNTLKSFFSKDKIKTRLPYGKKPVTVPRRANFLGSTNNQEFLTDSTGSVRWLCFEIDKIDWDYRKDINIDDIWRQAYFLYNQGFNYELTVAEFQENEIANSAFMVHTPEFELITKHFEADDEANNMDNFYTPTELLHYFQNIYGQNFKLNVQNIGKALKQLNIEKVKRYRNKVQITGYYLLKVMNVQIL